MHSRLIASMILLSSLSINPSFAEDASMQLQMLVDGLESYSADFTQKTYEQDGYLLDEQTGQIFFAPPGRLRWEAKEPYLQTLVADGETIHLYDPDLNQVTVRPWSDDAAQNPAAVFVSKQDLSSHFLIKKGAVGDSAFGESAAYEGFATAASQVFELTPLSPNSSITGLTIRFDLDTPVAMEILDTLGQRTKIEFSNAQLGTELDQALFMFSIPEGAEVITDG